MRHPEVRSLPGPCFYYFLTCNVCTAIGFHGLPAMRPKKCADDFGQSFAVMAREAEFPLGGAARRMREEIAFSEIKSGHGAALNHGQEAR